MGARRSKSATMANARSHCPGWVGGTQSDDMVHSQGPSAPICGGCRPLPLSSALKRVSSGGRYGRVARVASPRTWRTRARSCIASRTPPRRPAIAPDPRAGATTVSLNYGSFSSVVLDMIHLIAWGITAGRVRVSGHLNITLRITRSYCALQHWQAWRDDGSDKTQPPKITTYSGGNQPYSEPPLPR